MATSKRLINAKSERYYKATAPGSKRKQLGWWKSTKKALSGHIYLVIFFFFLTVMSGVVSFFMYEKHSRAMFGGSGSLDASLEEE